MAQHFGQQFTLATAGEAAELAAEIQQLTRTATETDGLPPFNEETLLNLAQRQAVTARDASGSLLGAALYRTHTDGMLSAELVVHPHARRRRVGTALARELTSLLTTHAAQQLQVWAHGSLPGSRELAASLGAIATRELYVLALPLHAPLPQPDLPAGMQIRAFDADRNARAWVALNAKIFAAHPEQGRLQLADLEARMRQPWFNSEDFLVLTADDELAGYCWCKIDGDEYEIYVVGVAPNLAGQGLGRTLMNAGLNRLLERGAKRAILYVDGSNTPAMSLYRRLGFVTERLDVQYFLDRTTVETSSATN
ncbi:mycothiol synthase [Gulosibacter hominis]|uniref:mycothiol synthase n=1 Tax=Gulosibacter hominis TaxID=2770504 RepID=UPI00191A9861|nr:mycothiol synthase [Gulosibacter hominis]